MGKVSGPELWSQALGELCEGFSFPLPLPSSAWAPGDGGHLYLPGAMALAWWGRCGLRARENVTAQPGSPCPQTCAEWEAPDIPPLTHSGQAALSSWAE